MEQNKTNMLNCILNNDYLEDDCINKFHEILQRKTNFRPVNIFQFIVPDLKKDIRPIPPTEELLQLLFREGSDDLFFFGDVVGHWTCIHYVNGQVMVYDSLYNNLSSFQMKCLKLLFPHNPTIHFPCVQRQTNNIDCGVFAIANGTSVALGKNPSEIVYDIKSMRLHLKNILISEELLEFPSHRRLKDISPCPNNKRKREEEIEKKKCLRNRKHLQNSVNDVITQIK